MGIHPLHDVPSLDPETGAMSALLPSCDPKIT